MMARLDGFALTAADRFGTIRIGRRELSTAWTLRAVARLGALALLWGFPVTLIALALVMHSGVAWDFRAFYAAGHSYLHLRSPYVTPSLANLTTRQNFVYPLPVAAAFAPLSLLSYQVAAALFIAASAIALLLALKVLGIRDWRCYVATMASFPAFFGLKLGTLSPFLALLLAILWRYRSRDRIAVPVLSLLVLSKLFLWPLAIWLLLMRRFRTFGLFIATCLAAVVLAASPYGFSVLTGYPSLLRAVSAFEGRLSLSPIGLLIGLGVPGAAATVISLALGAALLLYAARAARDGDESLAFRTSVVAALAMSPIVWDHYLLLMYIPLALYQKRFSVLWLGCAWVSVDGFVLDRTAMTLITLAIWFIIPLQAGVIPQAAAIPKQLVRWLQPIAVLAVWIALIVSLTVATRSIPVLAALRPTSDHLDASGSALLRLDRHGRDMCWLVNTEGIAAGASVRLVRDTPRVVLVAHSLGATRSFDTCSRIASAAEAAALAHAARSSRTAYAVEVVARDGRVLLTGSVRRLQDGGASRSYK